MHQHTNPMLSCTVLSLWSTISDKYQSKGTENYRVHRERTYLDPWNRICSILPQTTWILHRISLATLFAKNFIAGPNRKDKPVTKIINAALLFIAAVVLTITVILFSSAIRDPLANGAGVLWSSRDESYFDEIATGTTDEEKVKSVYTWMTENFTYDHNYDCLYQYSNITKTLQTKTGVCYDIS